MLTTVEAEIDVGGHVRLLESVEVKTKTRAIVTLLNEAAEKPEKGNAREMLEWLRNNRLPEASRHTAEEIEAQIQENRNSWD